MAHIPPLPISFLFFPGSHVPLCHSKSEAVWELPSCTATLFNFPLLKSHVCQASWRKCKVHQMESFCCSVCAQPSILHLKHMPSGSCFKHVEDEKGTILPCAASICMTLKWNRLAPATPPRNSYDTRGMWNGTDEICKCVTERGL